MKDFGFTMGLELPIFLAARVLRAKQIVELHAYEVLTQGEFLETFSFDKDFVSSPFNPAVKLHRTSTLVLDFTNLAGLVGVKELTPFTNIYFPISPRGELLAPFNKMAASFALKEPGGRFLNRVNQGVVGQLCVPFADSKFEDCSLRLTGNAALGIYVQGANPREIPNTHAAFQEFVQAGMPKLTSLSDKIEIRTSGTVQFQLMPPRAGVTIHLKCDMGYLPKREVVTDSNGRVSAKIMALGLDAGDEFDVEAGFKWYSNIARTRVKVLPL